MPMIATTIINSTRVKPFWLFCMVFIGRFLRLGCGVKNIVCIVSAIPTKYKHENRNSTSCASLYFHEGIFCGRHFFLKESGMLSEIRLRCWAFCAGCDGS
jgi:hypothetical protein